MEEGFYAIYFTGLASSGFGLFAACDGAISGVDAAGGSYDGQYLVNGSIIEGVLHLLCKSGLVLVNGTTIDRDQTVDVPFRLPKDFANGETVLIQTSFGPINTVFKYLQKIRSPAKIR